MNKSQNTQNKISSLKAMFEPKKKQEECKNQEPPKKTQEPKKFDGKALLEKMKKEQLQLNETKRNSSDSQTRQVNTSNLYQNSLNSFNEIEKKKKSNEEQDAKEKEERSRKAKINSEKIKQRQKQQLEEEKNKQIEEAKKEAERREEKERRDKEFKEKNDKNRYKYYDESRGSDWREAARKLLSKFNKKLINKTGETNIILDFSSRLAEIFILGNDSKMIRHQFANCISHSNNTVSYFNECEYFDYNLSTYKQGKIEYPVKEGELYDWDLLKLILNYSILDKISFDSYEECNLVFIEPINCSRENREKILEYFFYDYYFKKILIIKPAVFELIKRGEHTGLVALLDEDISTYVPVFGCKQSEQAIIKSDFCRRDIINYMEYLLSKEFTYMHCYNNDELNYIVNNSCYLASNYEKELTDYIEPFYFTLKEGNQISIKEPRIKCPEIMINPESHIKKTFDKNKSIVYNINESIKKCDNDKRRELYKNIILTGKNTKYKGLKERVLKELEKSGGRPYSVNVEVYDVYDKESNLVDKTQKSLEELFSGQVFEKLWITKEEYEEEGIYALDKHI